MTNITATFADGTTVTYKGRRAVFAAWRWTTETGRTHYGWSLDADTAHKTGLNNFRNEGIYVGIPPVPRRRLYAQETAYLAKKAKELGFKNIKEMAAEAARRKDAAEVGMTLEVVPTSLAIEIANR